MGLITGGPREFYIPFSHTLNKRILGDADKMTGFHIFSPKNAELLIKGQKKKGGISTFTTFKTEQSFVATLMNGIMGGSTYCAELEGTGLGKFGTDVSSAIGTSYRRWVEIGKFVAAYKDFDAKPWKNERNKFIKKFALDTWKNLESIAGITYEDVFNEYALNRNTPFATPEDKDEWIKHPWFTKIDTHSGKANPWYQMHEVIDDMWNYKTKGLDKPLFKKLKAHIIKNYMEWIEKLLTDNKEDYKKIQIGADQTDNDGKLPYNELIISDYNIKHVYACYQNNKYYKKKFKMKKDLLAIDGNTHPDDNRGTQIFIDAIKFFENKKIPITVEFDSKKGGGAIFKEISKDFS
jgi:hypothetical protein